MTDTTLESPLHRLHRALVQALRERDPAGLNRPFTVAEIYQDLVPYRTHRDLLGVEMNGDYEHLLLRLLAGEHELVVLESEHARREIEAELTRTNPNTGLFRDYAAVDVHLVAERIPAEGDGAPEIDDEAVILPAATYVEPEDETADEAETHEPEEVVEETHASVDELAPSETMEEDPMDTPAAEATDPDTALPGDDGVCHWCRETLPIRGNLNFCPYCGTDVRVRPCGSCGEAVEPGWHFCIQCGSSTGEG
mgnify:CR=1 FL=1